MRFPCIVLMPRDSSQTWASRVNVTAPRNSRFSQYPSPKQSFLIEVFEQRIWNSYNFFCFDGSKKKEIKRKSVFYSSTRWISTHAVFILSQYFLAFVEFRTGIAETSAVTNKASFCEPRRELEPRPCDVNRDKGRLVATEITRGGHRKRTTRVPRASSGEIPFTRVILFLKPSLVSYSLLSSIVVVENKILERERERIGFKRRKEIKEEFHVLSSR